MIISVPNSLKRSHRSRLSKVAVIVSTSSETSNAEQLAFGASSALLSSQDLSLFEDVEPNTWISSLPRGFFLFASSAPKDYKLKRIKSDKIISILLYWKKESKYTKFRRSPQLPALDIITERCEPVYKLSRRSRLPFENEYNFKDFTRKMHS